MVPWGPSLASGSVRDGCAELRVQTVGLGCGLSEEVLVVGYQDLSLCTELSGCGPLLHKSADPPQEGEEEREA